MSAETIARLTAPLPEEDVKFLIQATSKDGSKVLMAPYVDARTIIQRLNEVVPGRWKDEYEIRQGQIRGKAGPENGYYAICTLTIEGVGVHQDVGEGQFPKDAVSDALKRAAVKFGIGLELYKGEAVWVNAEHGRPKASREELLAIWKGEKPAPAPGPHPVERPSEASEGEPAASAKQVAFIKDMLKDKGVDPGKFLGWYTSKEGPLTRKRASELIEDLKGAAELIEVYKAEEEPEALF